MPVKCSVGSAGVRRNPRREGFVSGQPQCAKWIERIDLLAEISAGQILPGDVDGETHPSAHLAERAQNLGVRRDAPRVRVLLCPRDCSLDVGRKLGHVQIVDGEDLQTIVDLVRDGRGERVRCGHAANRSAFFMRLRMQSRKQGGGSALFWILVAVVYAVPIGQIDLTPQHVEARAQALQRRGAEVHRPLR
jgi:hypothetical protein